MLQSWILQLINASYLTNVSLISNHLGPKKDGDEKKYFQSVLVMKISFQNLAVYY